jgi:hypothetical protein
MNAKASWVLATALLFSVIGLAAAPRAGAHCDTLSGPVVMDARKALEKKDVTPVLKWVKQDDEAAIKEAFAKTLKVREQGPEAKEVADQWFFETLVRIHRAGEGAPFTGLKPAGTDLGPAVAGADKALETGSVDGLVKLVTDDVAKGIRERFNHALEKKKAKDKNVEAGREYVEAYVEFVHYVERLDQDATGAAHHGAEASEAGGSHHHE